MMTKCVSVRLDSLVSISDKAYKAVDFAGNEAIIPKSQVLARDYEVVKSDAWWISAWIMQQKNLQCSSKKTAWFDEKGNMQRVVIRHYKPEKKSPVTDNIINQLKK